MRFATTLHVTNHHVLSWNTSCIIIIRLGWSNLGTALAYPAAEMHIAWHSNVNFAAASGWLFTYMRQLKTNKLRRKLLKRTHTSASSRSGQVIQDITGGWVFKYDFNTPSSTMLHNSSHVWQMYDTWTILLPCLYHQKATRHLHGIAVGQSASLSAQLFTLESCELYEYPPVQLQWTMIDRLKSCPNIFHGKWWIYIHTLY